MKSLKNTLQESLRIKIDDKPEIDFSEASEIYRLTITREKIFIDIHVTDRITEYDNKLEIAGKNESLFCDAVHRGTYDHIFPHIVCKTDRFGTTIIMDPTLKDLFKSVADILYKTGYENIIHIDDKILDLFKDYDRIYNTLKLYSNNALTVGSWESILDGIQKHLQMI